MQLIDWESVVKPCLLGDLEHYEGYISRKQYTSAVMCIWLQVLRIGCAWLGKVDQRSYNMEETFLSTAES